MRIKQYPDYALLFAFLLNAVCVLMLLPSGLLHYYLGAFVYLRDVLLLGVLCLNIGVFILMRLYASEAGLIAGLLVALVLVPIGFASAFSGAESSVLIIFKWVVIWFVLYCFGHIFNRSFVAEKRLKWCFLVFVFLYFVLEALVGVYERHTMSFFVDFSGMQETAAGVGVGKDQQLGVSWFLRVRGFQRNVFVFSNNMQIASMFAAFLFVLSRRYWVRIVAVCSCVLFFYAVYISGGRSGLIGTVGFYVVIVGYWASRKVGLRGGLFSLFLVAICTANACLSFFGISGVVEFVSDAFFSESSIGNVNSTYDREGYWALLLGDLYESGGLIWGSVLFLLYNGDSVQVTYMDNQLLWFLYHLGLVGLVGYLLFQMSIVRFVFLRSQYLEAGVLAGAFSAIVMEGVARDSLFFLSSGFMMFCLGYAADVSVEAETNPDVEDSV